MQWLDLAFLHWPLAPSTLPLPPGIDLDLWEGQAWLGVIPFSMRVRARYLPALPGLSTTLELNVRTYIRSGGEAGVWFFSLDAAHPLLVRAARTAFCLPYFNARMGLARREGWTVYESRRTHRGAPSAIFRGRCRALSSPSQAPAGTLEHWLTERYCFVTSDCRGRLFRCDVRHEPWTLRAGECDLECVDMFRLLGLPAPTTAPLCHVAQPLEVLATRLLPVAGPEAHPGWGDG